MLFNSIEFFIFLPIVLFLYWIVLGKSLKAQNLLLLFASYVFYMWWDWRFVFLLIFSTALDFFSGLLIHQASTNRAKKMWLIISVCTNLGLLMFFKYYNFFVTSIDSAFHSVGISLDFATLNLVLPVGISFYTFHGMSYVFDIYRQKREPTTNFVDYSVFVSYFPLLVAGPIERASHLLPQVEKKRVWDKDQALEGVELVIWGLFKKVVVADSLALYVNQVFAKPNHESGAALVMGAIFFAFQIYGDFSGYTDIARGVSKWFGMELLLNFNFPYFSRSVPEFWKRWHISLSSWFRDYLFIPLGGSRGSKLKTLRNVLIVFLVSGFWHGANWTFIVWGGIHALMYIPSFIAGTHKSYSTREESGKFSIMELLKVIGTFSVVTLAWIFFRADTISKAFNYLKRMFSHLLDRPNIDARDLFNFVYILIILFFDYQLQRSKHIPIIWRYIFLLLAAILIINGKKTSFLYFQF